MKNIIISLIIIIALVSCKGRSSGPLAKDEFKKESMPMGGANHSSQVKPVKAAVNITPCADCITIAKLLADKKSFEGKTIKIRGQVTKFLPEIMGKNWIHLQDGTESDGAFDLTVTTGIQANTGDIITMEGKIVLDKDFGYGYFYNVLMEDGKSVK